MKCTLRYRAITDLTFSDLLWISSAYTNSHFYYDTILTLLKMIYMGITLKLLL